MTLKSKAIILSILTLLVASLSFVLYLQHKSITNDLFNAMVLLDEIKSSANELELNVIHNTFDASFFNQSINRIPEISKQLNKLLQLDTTPPHLVNLELSFVRIERIMNNSVPGYTLEEPLVKQLDHEIHKINTAAEELIIFSRQKLDSLKNWSDLITLFQFVTLILYSAGILLFPLENIITPLLQLCSQVKLVEIGETQNIPIPARKDEIGLLHRFIHNTISDLQTQTNELKQNRENLELQYQQQLAVTRILTLSITTGTMEELLEQTLQTVLSLEWLKIEEKGGIFLVRNGDKPHLELKSSHNFNPAILQACSNVPFGKCLCGRVAESEEFLHTTGIDDRHEISYEKMTAHGHYCIPIKFGNSLLGVMALYLETGKEANSGEIQFLQGIANILAHTMERRRLEEKQLLISTAIDHAGDGVIITNEKGTIQYVNPRITTLTGYKKEELLDNNITMLKSYSKDQDLYKQLTPSLFTDDIWEGTSANIRKDGALYDERIVTTAIKNQQNQITHYVSIKRDITREKILETQLLHSQKLEAVGTLAGGIAHDFNNILTYIIGYSEIILANISKNDPLRGNLEIILAAGEKAAVLVNQLMVFSRKQNVVMKPIDINGTVKNTAKMLRRLLEENVTLEIKTQEDIGEIMADTSHIEQVVANLVVNARDAMVNGGVLSIETAAVYFNEERAKRHENLIPGRYARLSVSDTGEGIPYAIQDHIFEPFFTTKGTGKGTGLGLATIYGIIKQHKGHIDVYSDPGYGTTFEILFPIIRNKSANIVAAINRILPGLPTGTEKILLVDDDPHVRSVIIDTLKPLGYKIMEGSHGKEALEISAAWPDKIDLLLTDVIMPGTSGVELAETIQRLRPDIKIIFMSGYPDQNMILQKIMTTGHILIEKPMLPSKLATVIRTVLDR